MGDCGGKRDVARNVSTANAVNAAVATNLSMPGNRGFDNADNIATGGVKESATRYKRPTDGVSRTVEAADNEETRYTYRFVSFVFAPGQASYLCYTLSYALSRQYP
jgi:hypothetical protein